MGVRVSPSALIIAAQRPNLSVVSAVIPISPTKTQLLSQGVVVAGSIHLRRQPNVWELRVFVGRDANGKVKHRYSTSVGPKRDAESELAHQLLLIDEAPASAIGGTKWNKHTTFNEAIEAWKANGLRGSVSKDSDDLQSALEQIHPRRYRYRYPFHQLYQYLREMVLHLSAVTSKSSQGSHGRVESRLWECRPTPGPGFPTLSRG
ncbi:MAG: hypothetical protein ACYDHP_10130 [Ferrimicrobium sp.]